jgi:hypothetical protein
MSTTACNKGSAVVPWLKAMNPNHPFIAFLVAKDDGTRLRQISNRSFVKHTFFALEQDFCGTCQGGDPENGTFLGLGCSDTYSKSTNGNRTWLGPPDEIDPWSGGWDPVCSYFDGGDPTVPPPADCDGFRSLDPNQVSLFSPVKNRVAVEDAELLDGGPERYFYQAQYVIRGEVEAQRANNLGWREFQPIWGGVEWIFTDLSALSLGSVLDAWIGADVSSSTNGADDGRVFVAVRVTGPVDGIYHYEYAVHNRDNGRGVSSFRLPICDEATILNVGFLDVDGSPADDWTASVGAGELAWTTTDNPLGWNSIYNFWFDSDAAPIDGVTATLDQFSSGAGAASLSVSTRVPKGLYDYELGPGCSFGTVPRLFGTGTPDRALLGNATYSVRSVDCAPNTTLVFAFTPFGQVLDLGGGCTWYLSNQKIFVRLRSSDSAGVGSLALPIPADPTLEGVDLNLQLLELDPSGGPFANDFDISNGQRVRIGDAVPSCP